MKDGPDRENRLAELLAAGHPFLLCMTLPLWALTPPLSLAVFFFEVAVWEAD